MITHILPAPAGELPLLLFQPLIVTAEGDEIERAIGTAGRRWPVLQPSLEGAARLVRAQGVCEAPAEAPELALVRVPAERRFHAVSPSPTGLTCTCDGWPPAVRAGPGDGLYCPDILAYLLDLYLSTSLKACAEPAEATGLHRPFATLPYTPDQLWQVTLKELRLQMTRATFNQWLLGSAVVSEASTPFSLTVAVRNRYAQEWLTHRLREVVVRALAAVAGYQVQVHFVVL
jgi:hypothetical protein